MTSRNVLEGIFRLPGRVDLKLDVLGTTSPARIREQDVQVVTPAWKQVEKARAVAVGPVLEIVSQTVDWGARYKVHGDFWGTISHFTGADFSTYEGNAQVDAVVIRRIFDQHESAENIEGSGRAIYEGIDPWWRLACDWIEVVARQNIRPRHSDGSRAGNGIEMWLRHEGQARDVWNPAPIHATMSPINALTREMWQGILGAASDGRQPPTEYLLLRDSFAANRRGQGRRAVLDAATAAELALTRLLDQELAAGRQDLATYVKDQSKQIGGRIRALTALGIQIPGGGKNNQLVMEHLAAPRNKAMAV